jgi:GLPGLI family protein
MCCCFSFAQNNFRFVYNYKFQLDSTDTNSIRNELLYLDIMDTKSICISQNMFKQDSVTYNAYKNPNQISNIFHAPAKTKIRYKIVKDNSDKSLFYILKIMRTPIGFKSRSIDFNWKIVNDTMTINNLKCKKATMNFGKRKLIAWYTEEIPVSDGPYKFNGLPGLITKISDTKNQHIFELVAHNKLNEIPENYLDQKRNKILSEEEYNKFMSEFRDNPRPFLESEGGSVISGVMLDAMVTKSKERQKTENNPIELQ